MRPPTDPAIRAAVLAEREACAKIAEEMTIEEQGMKRYARDGHWIGTMIRARSETEVMP